VLIPTKPASADDYLRDSERKAYEDMLDLLYFGMEVKDAFFQSDQSNTTVYDQRSYVNNEALKK
jgi:hypothetical protein